MIKVITSRFICHNKYIEESELERAVMIQSKEAKQLTYELLENNYIQMQELRKTISSTVPSKSLYLYYCDLMSVARVQLTRCYQSSANLIVRRQWEAEQQARLLEKQERIEAITATLRASGGNEEQLRDIQEMMSPLETEALAKVHSKLSGLSNALAQSSDTLLLLKIFLKLRIK